MVFYLRGSVWDTAKENCSQERFLKILIRLGVLHKSSCSFCDFRFLNGKQGSVNREYYFFWNIISFWSKKLLNKNLLFIFCRKSGSDYLYLQPKVKTLGFYGIEKRVNYALETDQEKRTQKRSFEEEVKIYGMYYCFWKFFVWQITASK